MCGLTPRTHPAPPVRTRRGARRQRKQGLQRAAKFFTNRHLALAWSTWRGFAVAAGDKRASGGKALSFWLNRQVRTGLVVVAVVVAVVMLHAAHCVRSAQGRRGRGSVRGAGGGAERCGAGRVVGAACRAAIRAGERLQI